MFLSIRKISVANVDSCWILVINFKNSFQKSEYTFFFHGIRWAEEATSPLLVGLNRTQDFAVCLSQTLATRCWAMMPPLFGLPVGSSLYLVGCLLEGKGKETASKYNAEVGIV